MRCSRVHREIPLSELVSNRRATDNFSSEADSDSDLQQIVYRAMLYSHSFGANSS
jgi:hypothetical protein